MRLRLNFNNFMKRTIDEIQTNDYDKYMESIEKYSSLYDDVCNKEIKCLLSYLHLKFNNLFRFMNHKFDSNRHYNADPSRELLNTIEVYYNLQNALNSTNYSYAIIDDYSEKIKESLTFLKESGGSEIPISYKKLNIVEYEPIFITSDTIPIKTNYISNENLTYIGSGSYANVYKFKHPDFDKYFALKRANKNSSSKDLLRFRREFETMKSINSPYVVEVFNYNNNDNSYIMEFLDYTLDEFYKKNNDKLKVKDRLSLINQVFNIFGYLHKKEILHRDISYTNILIKEYEDTNIIKISDFGRVKILDSSLTSANTVITGSLNDRKLLQIGFDKYSFIHETYALTSIIYFLMFGRKNLNNYEDTFMKEFVNKGISDYDDERFQDIKEMRKCFYKFYNTYSRIKK